MGGYQLLEQARHARHRLPGLLGHHQGVPGRDHGAGQPGGQDGVVDIRDDAEGLVLVDHLDGNPIGGAPRTVYAHLVPADG